MSRYRAEFRMIVEVEFDDDGKHDLRDLAFEAIEYKLDVNHGFEIELIASSVKPVVEASR